MFLLIFDFPFKFIIGTSKLFLLVLGAIHTKYIFFLFLISFISLQFEIVLEHKAKNLVVE